MLLTIEVTEIARSKEAVEFTILTLDEARVAITTPIIIGSTNAFSNGNRGAPGLTTIGRATHHDVDDVTATDIGVALITLVCCNNDATVISNNHSWDAIDTTTIVAWQERIRMSIENHCSPVCRIAYGCEVEVCHIVIAGVSDTCYRCINNGSKCSVVLYCCTNPIIMCTSREVFNTECRC